MLGKILQDISLQKSNPAGHGGTPVIPALGRLRQKDGEFEDRLRKLIETITKKKKVRSL
jgi:hypothetical protein